MKIHEKIANIMRRDVLKMTAEAGSGHPTTCLSCAEIISVLFFRVMQWDTRNPLNPNNDEFILSKGHAAPILYSALYRAGAIRHDLMKLRNLKSPLEGHPMPNSLRWVKVATGSLGQGLSIGAGMALAAKRQKRKYNSYVLLGDGEMAEGSVFEAMELASYYNLNNLCAIVDVNRLGQTGATMVGHRLNEYSKRFRALGWETIIVDGHDVDEIHDALKRFHESKKPFAIIAKTYKGRGVSFLENKNGWHGKALGKDELKKALEEIPDVEMPKVAIKKPKRIFPKKEKKKRLRKLNFKDPLATRKAYGKALANLAQADERVVALDGEVSNSTYSEHVKDSSPGQFIECFIAEQNMIGMALGLSVKGFNVFASSFSAFLSRAHDQIRMSAVSSANMTIAGSHAGVSIGEDGASQMGLEDIAMMRALPNSIVFYPSDAKCSEKLTYLASKLDGIKYIRTTRPDAYSIYSDKESFEVGGYKVLKKSSKDKAVVIGAGITLYEALKAYNLLKESNVSIAVIDLYCIKPLKAKRLLNFIKSHGNKVVVAEDHYREGGIGEMLAMELGGIKINSLHVHKLPHSGTKKQLLSEQKIDAKAIMKKVNAAISSKD